MQVNDKATKFEQVVIEPDLSLLISLNEAYGNWVLTYAGAYRYNLYFYYGKEEAAEAKLFGEPTAGLYGRILGSCSLREGLTYVAETCGEEFTMSWRQIPPGTAWFNWTPEDHKWWYTHSEQPVEVTA